MDETITKRVDYMDDKLVQDPAFRQSLLAAICKVLVLCGLDYVH